MDKLGNNILMASLNISLQASIYLLLLYRNKRFQLFKEMVVVVDTVV